MKTQIENSSCGGSGPHSAGEVRALPTGGDSNAILCRACFNHEITFRKDRNSELDESARFDLPAWEDLKAYGEVKTLEEKLGEFAALIEADKKAYMERNNYGSWQFDSIGKTAIKPGKKYAKVDVGQSGKYMVNIETGAIVGIKAYGVPHLGHQFGTLDTIQEWDWSEYTARRKHFQAA